MQSSMVRPFERSRKDILTRRANHRHILIVARIKPAPENPPRAFSIRRYAVRPTTAERAEPGRRGEPNASDRNRDARPMMRGRNGRRDSRLVAINQAGW